MNDRVAIAAQQLQRMRGMTSLYHKQFFSDIRFSIVTVAGLFAIGFWEVPQVLPLIPVVALIGAAQTAFDASYLIFARQYATRLEQYINAELGETVLVAARLESAYLFPLDATKVVTLRVGSGFTWFGFMTAFYTLIGVGGFVAGLAVAIPVLDEAGPALLVSYVVALAGLGVAALAVGFWWFVGGAGERRLRAVLDSAFGD